MMSLLQRLRKPHMQPVVRMAAIIVVVASIDCLYVLFAAKPLPGAALIPATIPLLVAVFVVPSVMRQKS